MNRQTWKQKILWVDGIGGLAVGLLVLALCPLLSSWYQLPLSVVLFVGIANLTYGCFSTTLASRMRRPLHLISTLAIANISWGFVCAGLIYRYSNDASWLAIAHIGGEGFYVAGLGAIEWRIREQLIDRAPGHQP